MPVTYTNRKGATYTLYKSLTKTGKPRYYFARKSEKGEPVEQMPAGYEISESVNGIVSLAKARPKLILPEEVAVVEAAVSRHPKSGNYRVNVKHNRIEIYERIGPNADEMFSSLKDIMGFALPGARDAMREIMDRGAQFSAVLRFTLADKEQRTFRAERWCYLGSIDDWIDIGPLASIKQLANDLIPRLGSDAYYEFY